MHDEKTRVEPPSPPKKKLSEYDSNSRSWDLKPSAYSLGQSTIALERVIFPKVLIIYYGLLSPPEIASPWNGFGRSVNLYIVCKF